MSVDDVYVRIQRLSTLVSNFTIGPGSRLLFGGCSAGARGEMFTLDYVPAMLRGFLDSPLWVGIQPEQEGNVPLRNQTQGVVACST
jgi:hypothetical protein